MKLKYFNVVFCTLIFFAILLLSERNIQAMKHLLGYNAKDKSNQPVVVIDAGHGGFDPGKVGINNALEKDINLAIALELKELLELNDITVIMTRDTDAGLYEETDSNKKAADMKKRMGIINQSNVTLAVSVHQNSFTQESSHGAQVFYYSPSEKGKQFASLMQEQIKKSIADDNHRVEKANDSYYLLKKSNCPLIIVECGFLSNHKEAERLISTEYQRKMAWAIHLGILNYLNAQ